MHMRSFSSVFIFKSFKKLPTYFLACSTKLACINLVPGLKLMSSCHAYFHGWKKPTCNGQKNRLETTPCAHNLHSKKRTTCSGLMKTAMNNVLLRTLFKVVNNIVQHCYVCLQASSGSTILNNIVDNIEQCGQQYIVQACFHLAKTGCSFLAVYTKSPSQEVLDMRRTNNNDF